MDIVAVLAGNKQEFDITLNNQILRRTKRDFEIKSGDIVVDNERYIYISHKDALRGLKIKRYVIIGSFFDRKDCYEIQEQADLRIK